MCPLIFVTKTIVRAGNIPAQPCIPAVVPKLPTKLAVDSLTPSLFVRVEIVTGRQPTLDLDVNARIKSEIHFFT